MRVLLKPDKVVLSTKANDDIELERWTLARKGEFASEVFGE